MKIKSALFAAALATLASSAQAADPYLIGAFGQSDLDYPYADDSDTYLGLGVGFALSPVLAIEAMYNDYGDFGDRNNDVSVDSLSGALAASLPLDKSINLSGRIGFESWEADADYGGSDDGADLFIGFGVGFDVDRQINIAVEYSMHDFDDADADVLNLALRYKL